MIGGMKQRLLAVLLACTLSFAVPVTSRGADDDDKPKIDARLEGYKDGTNMGLKDASGTATSWLLLIVLTAMCVGVLFINSKRTHLD